MYAVTVQYRAPRNGWIAETASPTFYLDERVQGIVDEEHAKRIVSRWQADVLDPDVDYYVTAVKL